MKLHLKNTDPDFENFAVEFNGNLLRHSTIVSVDVVRRRAEVLAIDDTGVIADEVRTIRGVLHIINRNEAVIEKEPLPLPPSERVVRTKAGAKTSTQSNPEVSGSKKGPKSK